MKFVALLLFAAILILPVSASSAEITTWYNDKTYDSNLDIIINISESIKFNVTANQSIDTWNWSIDNIDVLNNNFDNFTTSWGTTGIINVSINATNSNGSDAITWKVTVQEQETETDISGPEIISWYNNKTNNNELEIILNINETIKFNVTANQSIDTWKWSIDNVDKNNNYDFFSTSWDTTGVKEVSVNATNSNGSDTITWKVTVKTVTEKGIILSWEPEQIVDYIYVNDTITETIKYSITTSVPMDDPKWTVDGPVIGTVSGNTYSYTHTWDNKSIGSPHKIIFTGSYDDSLIIFKWYVNVYEIEDYSGGRHIFGIIDDALRNHAAEVQIRMEKRKVHMMGDKGDEYLAKKVNLLHDEIDKRQSTRAALRDDFKSRQISKEEYVSALQQAQVDAKYNKKILQELEKDLAKGANSKSKYNNGKNDPEVNNEKWLETNMTISKSNNGKGNDKDKHTD